MDSDKEEFEKSVTEDSSVNSENEEETQFKDLNVVLDAKRTGKFIREIRNAHNMTQDDLGDILFVTRKAVSKWETGRSLPNIDNMHEICRQFNLTMEELILGRKSEEHVNLGISQEELTKMINDKNKEKKNYSFIIGVLIFLIIAIISFSGSSTKVYKIDYEDKNFSVLNGVLFLSRYESYIRLGDFHSNLTETDDDTDYDFSLVLKDAEEYEELFNFNYTDATPITMKLKERLSRILNSEDEKIYLKVSYTDENQIETSYILDILTPGNNDYELWEFDKENFASEVIGIYNSNLLLNERNTRLESDIKVSNMSEPVDFSFIYNLEIDEVKNIFAGKQFRYNNKTCDIYFDNTYDTDCLFLKNCRSNLQFVLNKDIVLLDDNWFYLKDGYLLNEKIEHSDYVLFSDISLELRKVYMSYKR